MDLLVLLLNVVADISLKSGAIGVLQPPSAIIKVKAAIVLQALESKFIFFIGKNSFASVMVFC